ncbi:MAG: DUF2723 domain-containing protein [bacterium]
MSEDSECAEEVEKSQTEESDRLNGLRSFLLSEAPRSHRVFFASLTVLLPFILYLVTLCPTIYPGDSAELISAAHVLGIPHPTGYPTFMILGRLAQSILPGSPALSMNILCAAFGALGCLGVWLLTREIWMHAVGEERARRYPFLFASSAVALLAGFASTWWDQSTQTEVYSLFLVFLTGAWWLALRLIRKPEPGGLYILALWSGIAFTHHLLFMVTAAPSIIATVLLWKRGKNFKPIMAAAVLLIAPIIIGYLYLPIRAQADPEINWSNPTNFGKAISHLSGGQFKTTFVLTEQTPQGIHKITAAELPGFVKERWKEILEWTGSQVLRPVSDNDVRLPALGLLLLALFAFGLVALFRQSSPAAWGLGLSFLHALLLVTIYTIADIEAYQLPLWILLLLMAPIAAALGRNLFLADPDSESQSGKGAYEYRALIAGVVILALAVVALGAWYPATYEIKKSNATQAHDFAIGAMQSLPPDAVIFTRHDYDIYPLWYAQICEDKRPDIAVIGSNFVFNGWYAEMLRQTLPEGVEVFIGNEPPSTSERWLVAVMGGMFAPQFDAGKRVFITSLYPEMPIFQRYYEIKPLADFNMPAPKMAPLFQDSENPAPPIPQITIYELIDSQNMSATAKAQFQQMFGPRAQRLVRREAPRESD